MNISRMINHRPWVYLTLAFAPVIPVAALTWRLAASGRPDFTLFIAWCVWAIVTSALYIRRLDETARSAQRWAWEWGGALGLAGAVLAALFGWYLFPGLADAFGRFVAARTEYPAAAGFVYGAGFAAIVAISGWFIALIVWWLPKLGGGK